MLSRDDILAAYAAGPEAIVQLVETFQSQLSQQIDTLTAHVAELEARLNKDSHNSSKPPSSDGLAKKPARSRSLRKRSGKKSGGQPGHPGVTLQLVDDPTDCQVWMPAVCSTCGTSLAKAEVVARERRQVIDLSLKFSGLNEIPVVDWWDDHSPSHSDQRIGGRHSDPDACNA